jgi:small subunit ribosomal protein S21
MATVRVNPNIPQEAAIKIALSQFKKKVEQEGILKDLRKKEFYIKPSVAKKMKSIAARKNAKKKIRNFKDRD